MHPSLTSASIDALAARSRLLAKLRTFFYDRDFVEVQTPILSQDIVIDRHLDPLVVQVPGATSRHGESQEWYLQTSPEQNMKRLVASGMKAIFQIGPVFRAGEVGRLHNPEFTMAEWYRVGDDLNGGVRFLEEMVESMLVTPPPIRSTFCDEFRRWIGLDPLEASLEQLATESIRRGYVSSPTWSEDRDDWIDLLFSHDVQPNLGLETPLVLTHFPASQAALAQLSHELPGTAERFELFYRGVELANGYHELLDRDTLERRNIVANEQRVRDGRRPLPVRNRLLEAMEIGLPPCSGCALGFDRLVMLAIGAQRLEDVLCFPWDRA